MSGCIAAFWQLDWPYLQCRHHNRWRCKQRRTGEVMIGRGRCQLPDLVGSVRHIIAPLPYRGAPEHGPDPKVIG